MQHRRALAQVYLAAAALIGCAAFAVWPLESISVQSPVIVQPQMTTKQITALDLAAFRVPLWVVEPPPPPSSQAQLASPPPPLNLQLLAIVRDGEVYKAALYDPDLDRILVVAPGEKIGSRSVHSVNKSSVRLRDDTGDRVLALKAGEQGT